MAYIPKQWKDLPDETTPIQASDLNHIEQGIGDLNTSIGDLNTLNTTNKSSIVGAINEVYQNNVYSTDETVVGKWIDGKTIYRKIFNYSGEMVLNEDNELGTIDNLKTPIHIYGTVKFVNENLWWLLPRVVNTNSTDTHWAIDIKISNNVVYAVKGGYGTTEKAYVIVEYTKTTD